MTLTRVEYFDIALDPSVAQLSADDVRAAGWATPVWANADAQVIVGQALWVIEAGDRVVVVDPCGASDEFLRTGPDAIGHQERVIDAMRAAAFDPDRVDTVVLTHLDGIGMAAAVTPEGGWAPLFRNARIVMTRLELEYLDTAPNVMGRDALDELRAAGAVDAIEDRAEVAPGVRLCLTGGHSPGHAVVRVAGDDHDAVLLGHLAITPLQFTQPAHPDAHLDAERAAGALDALLAESSGRDTVLIGPLWPAPGALTLDAARVPTPVGAT